VVLCKVCEKSLSCSKEREGVEWSNLWEEEGEAKWDEEREL